jgi:hypothetical protein
MAKTVILRPVFNRPEMLFLSLEYEIAAREYFLGDFDLDTMFIIEHGTPKETIEVLDKYPYPFKYVIREKKYGLSPNILEGMKAAFNEAGENIIYIEDDILLHKTYFKYMDTLLKHPDLGKYSILSGYNQNDNGDVSEVYKGHHYAALAPLINKDFYERYIYPCSIIQFYTNPVGVVVALNERYKEHQKSGKYKYKDSQHHQQAGLINRLVDAAMIDDDMYVYMPRVNRQQHIGFYGANRPGKGIPGDTFDERVENLRDIITSEEKLFAATDAKQYNDYKIFSPKLDEWTGDIVIK